MATRRKERNRIGKLTDEEWVKFDAPQDLCRIAHEYLVKLFQSSEAHYDPVISQIKPKISAEENSRLMEPFTSEEFRAALFQMNPD